MPNHSGFDVAIVGAGIIGLAHAWAAARRGKRVVVIEREGQANGASIRNFGFITVTGQERGETWRLARRARDVWAEIAPQAGIAVHHRGLILTMRRPEAVAVAESFLKTEMGEDCRLWAKTELAACCPRIATSEGLGAIYSPHELRVESRDAIPQLTTWLQASLGVEIRFNTAALHVEPPRIETSRGVISAETAIVCPGDDVASLLPDVIAAHRPTRCRLSMLRLAAPGFPWPAGLMSDLGLARYKGYAALPEAKALQARLAVEQSAHLAHGVHLIVVQSADGSLVVGDSHHYHDVPPPFAPAEAEALILDEFTRATGLVPPPVLERWTGTYASVDGMTYFTAAPSPAVRLVMVTSGTGASISFGLAEGTLTNLFGTAETAS